MPNEEQSAEALFSSSPRPRAWCQFCEPDLDPVREFVTPQRCSTHDVSRDILGPDDPLVEVGTAYLGGAAEADPVLGRAIERIIRDADRERHDRAA